MRVARRARLSVAAAACGVCLGYATAAVGLTPTFFSRLSAQHSSASPSAADLQTLVRHMGGGSESSAFEQAVAWRVLGGATFLLPLVEAASDGTQMLLTFPTPSGNVLGVFTDEKEFARVVEANRPQRVVARRVTGEQVFEAMQQVTDPARAAANPAARVTGLSIDAKLLLSWDVAREAWRQAVEQSWVRATLQRAKTTAEIDEAIRAVALGERGLWVVPQRRDANGKLSFFASDMGGTAPLLLLFATTDHALRAFPPPEYELSMTGSSVIPNLVKGQPLGLVHDLLEDGRVGFVTLDKERLQRLQKKH